MNSSLKFISGTRVMAGVRFYYGPEKWPRPLDKLIFVRADRILCRIVLMFKRSLISELKKGTDRNTLLNS